MAAEAFAFLVIFIVLFRILKPRRVTSVFPHEEHKV